MTKPQRFFAVVSPGLEQILLGEFQALGFSQCEVDEGGVTFPGGAREMQRANLHLRTATRVLHRVATFHASAFHELERGVKRLPWERFLAPDTKVRLRVTCRKSRLYHSDAVAERIVGVLDRRRSGAAGISVDEGDEAPEPRDEREQLFVVRIDRDYCSVSADTSGSALYFRGYREALARAPMRETLAAALIQASGWTPDVPLIDPMCGSGTIPIEAALIARRIAPGIAAADREPRTFAFQRWPDFDRELWNLEVEAARAAVLETAPAPIAGSDRDAGAIQAAVSNARRAGVQGDIEFATKAISAITRQNAAGAIVSNPPYGKRVGDERVLRNLYARLGRVLRAGFADWNVTLLSGSRFLETQTTLHFRLMARTRNGGIPVRIVRADLGDSLDSGGS